MDASSDSPCGLPGYAAGGKGEVSMIEDQPDFRQMTADTVGKEGKPESDCPIMHGKLCIEWVKGWKAFHEGEIRAAA